MDKFHLSVKYVSLVLIVIFLNGCGSDDHAGVDSSNPDYKILAPDNLRSEVLGGNISLAWNASDYATLYEVTHSLDGDFIEDSVVNSYTTSNTKIEIPIANKKRNHFFRIVSSDGNLSSSQSDTLLVFTFLEVSGENNEVIIDHLNDKEWKRCHEGETWNSASNTCTGSAALYSLSDAAALFETDDENGWSLSLWGGAAHTSSYDTYSCMLDSSLPSELLNLGGCFDNRLYEKRSSLEHIVDENFKDQCKAFLSDKFPTLSYEKFYISKLPVHCSSTRLYTKKLTSTISAPVLPGSEKEPSPILLNRDPS